MVNLRSINSNDLPQWVYWNESQQISLDQSHEGAWRTRPQSHPSAAHRLEFKVRARVPDQPLTRPGGFDWLQEQSATSCSPSLRRP